MDRVRQSSYMRRKALSAAYGAHVVAWNKWRYWQRIAAEDARWLADAPRREAARARMKEEAEAWLEGERRWEAGLERGSRYAKRMALRRAYGAHVDDYHRWLRRFRNYAGYG